MKKQLICCSEDPVRLDMYLKQTEAFMRSRQDVKRYTSDFMVNARPAKLSTILKQGDRLSYRLLLTKPMSQQCKPLCAETLGIKTVYEDKWIWVIDKPPHISTHPARLPSADEVTQPTVFEALLSREGYAFDLTGNLRDGVVHRLDKETSGVMILAKVPEAVDGLEAQFKSRTVTKIYHALIKGNLYRSKRVLDFPLRRHRRHPLKRMVSLRSKEGRGAITSYEVAAYYKDYTYVHVFPLTGRTHQIRVHFSYLGHPIYGDSLYDPNHSQKNNLHLVAMSLSVQHPIDHRQMTFTVDMPSFFLATLQALAPSHG